MKTLEEQIHEEIALVVERIIRASKSSAIAALELSFTQMGQQAIQSPTVQAIQPRQSEVKARKQTKQTKPPRSNEEIAELSERLLKVVQDNPGQPMTILAPQLGLKPIQLKVPAARLKATKKIKTIGERTKTCYFPVLEDGTATSFR